MITALLHVYIATAFVKRLMVRTAFGTVGHWGHIHGRKNLYDALITLGIVDGAWKIVGLELLEEKRIDPYAKETSSDSETG